LRRAIWIARPASGPRTSPFAARWGSRSPDGPRLVYQRLTKDVDVSPNWPLAFETGIWEGHADTIAGRVLIGGRYSAQWVKRDGRWLIRSEVFVALTCAGIGCESVAVP
jgi:hypothetical protein